ncbi:23S rRNA (adenine(2503)-C(2))-methyltransferase RlmN [Haloferula sp.]|uniref:23S rRNA (adenine(2503)-C(2))-methyltransferase RlmN n=1 Tax=Haloferula sp. TaxID=2497595 RepID=UPI0032A03FC2
MDGALDGRKYEELGELLAADGVSRAHALPLFRWIQTGGEKDMRGPLKRWIDARGGDLRTRVDQVRETPSGDGWTNKFLLGMADGSEVETVLMGFSGRLTACLSTQVGCAMGCVFCATGQMGFTRHLSAGEIVAQARHVADEAKSKHGERIRNLVMMGMGEPLHNFDETMRALDVLTDTRGMCIGATKVTVSTVGHVPGILKLARHPQKYSLAVSLHGATDEERGKLIPVNRRWPLADLMDACREYTEIKGMEVFIAWTLIGGVNDDLAQAERLASLLKGMKVHVNLIPLNPTDGYGGEAPADERVDAFQDVLLDAGLPVTVRQRRGIDVAAGCGQLSTTKKKESKPVK